MLGIAATLLFTLPGDGFGIVLALFAGFFLYIGASDLIPESYHAHPKFLTTAMTAGGRGRPVPRDQVHRLNRVRPSRLNPAAAPARSAGSSPRFPPDASMMQRDGRPLQRRQSLAQKNESG